MPTAVENLGENRVRLTVDVSPDQVRHAIDHAMSDLSESVKIPGFRKGKIPTPVLVSRLGKERIYAEAVDSHIGGWFWSAASRSRVRPVSDPQYEFELPDTAEDAWSFVATVEVQALPELADWTRSKCPVPRSRSHRSRWTPRSRRCVSGLPSSHPRVPAGARGRHARRGPRRLRRRGPARHRRRARRREARVRARSCARRRIRRRDEGDRVPMADGSSSTVEVTVREVQEKVLPDLDDELARAASSSTRSQSCMPASRPRSGTSSTQRSTRHSGSPPSTSSSAPGSQARAAPRPHPCR